MKLTPFQIEHTCEACGHQQVATIEITTVEVNTEDPDRFVQELVETLKTKETY